MHLLTTITDKQCPVAWEKGHDPSRKFAPH